MPRLLFDQKDVVVAVNAGLKSVNLYEIANEELITREDLERFMRAALTALATPSPQTRVSVQEGNGHE